MSVQVSALSGHILLKGRDRVCFLQLFGPGGRKTRGYVLLNASDCRNLAQSLVEYAEEFEQDDA